jgi:hypothetical protein
VLALETCLLGHLDVWLVNIGGTADLLFAFIQSAWDRLEPGTLGRIFLRRNLNCPALAGNNPH